MLVSELPTPCALVERSIVERNTVRMAERVSELGARLRPHVKTHKCVEAARLAVRGHFGGITVSTLAEARFFAQTGFDDITWAVPISAGRIGEALEIGRNLRAFNLLVDHPRTVELLEEAARRAGVRPSVLLKVDCGYHRAGVDPERLESLALAERLAASSALDFSGLLTHAGHAYSCRSRDEIRVIAAQERAVVVGFAERLRQRGVVVREVSIGSTPTLSVVESLEGVTEVRPGNYVFFDAFQASIGSCTSADAAFSVLSTVIGHYDDPARALIDAGALALSKDIGAQHVDAALGYGLLRRPNGGELPGLTLDSLSQEHGIVRGGAEALAAISVGDRVRVVANHSCLAAALHERFHLVDGERVVGEWRPARGWWLAAAGIRRSRPAPR